MTLRIETHTGARSTTIRLVGRIQVEHLDELAAQIGQGGSDVALDLEQVMLVDVEAVRFLGSCELQGVKLLHCSPFIRDWIAKERRWSAQV